MCDNKCCKKAEAEIGSKKLTMDGCKVVSILGIDMFIHDVRCWDCRSLLGGMPANSLLSRFFCRKCKALWYVSTKRSMEMSYLKKEVRGENKCSGICLKSGADQELNPPTAID